MRILSYIFAIAMTASMAMPINGTAQESQRRVVIKDVPAVKPIKHVSAANTHSGYAVPRYVSLKFDRVNGRQGPSVKHRALWQYQRKGLPLIVVAEMDIWRKVRDMHGDESWVRTQALSGEKHVVTLEDVDLLSKPRIGTRVKASAARSALLKLTECNAEKWCRVESQSGHKGWVQKQKLWGVAPL